MSTFPMNKQDMEAQGLERVDFCLVTGDAFIDHPSFGAAIIARVLESKGYTVGIIAQPDWHSAAPFKALGRPRLAFLVTAGNIDSMVNHYTAAKKPRSSDAYTPGGKAGARPDRATIVYTNRIREAYKNVNIVLGGIEASLRRFAHYDYWDDKVRRSILIDSGADLLLYGMAERQLAEVAEALHSGLRAKEITWIDGTCCAVETLEGTVDYGTLPSYEDVAADKEAYARAHMMEQQNAGAVNGKRLVQKHGDKWLLCNPPALPLSARELDEVYALPFTRLPHPSYTQHIPALDEIEFSITSNRGCFGGCSFCALTFHQGRLLQARSHDSILKEAEQMTRSLRFKGNIHDVGGPTADFRIPACERQATHGACKDRACLSPRCSNLKVSHTDYVALLRKLRAVKGVKRVFVRSGIRFDYVVYDKDNEFLHDLCKYHVSGQLKIAPEHVNGRVLELMGKPDVEIYERFLQKYKAMNARLGKEQYTVPYFMSSHPGSDLHAAIELALYLKETGQRPEQVQDFYPTPGTLSTAMFYTGLDPRTMRPVYVPKDPREKMLQRALLQYYRKENAAKVREALQKAGREDLIGNGKRCLVQPSPAGQNAVQRGTAQRVTKQRGPAQAQGKGKRAGTRSAAGRSASPGAKPAAKNDRRGGKKGRK